MDGRIYIRLVIGILLLAIAGTVLYFALQTRKPLNHYTTPVEAIADEGKDTDESPDNQDTRETAHFARRKDKYQFGKEPVDIKMPKTKKRTPKKSDELQAAKKEIVPAPVKPVAQPVKTEAPKPSSDKLDLSDEEKKKIEQASLRLQEEMMKNMSDEEKQEYVKFQQEFTKMLESDEFKNQVAEVEQRMKDDPKFKKEVEDFNKEMLNSMTQLSDELDRKQAQ